MPVYTPFSHTTKYYCIYLFSCIQQINFMNCDKFYTFQIQHTRTLISWLCSLKEGKITLNKYYNNQLQCSKWTMTVKTRCYSMCVGYVSMYNKLSPNHSVLKQKIFTLQFLWVRNLFTTQLCPLKKFNMYILEDDRAGLSEKLNVEEAEKEIGKKSSDFWLHQLPGGIIMPHIIGIIILQASSLFYPCYYYLLIQQIKCFSQLILILHFFSLIY